MYYILMMMHFDLFYFSKKSMYEDFLIAHSQWDYTRVYGKTLNYIFVAHWKKREVKILKGEKCIVFSIIWHRKSPWLFVNWIVHSKKTSTKEEVIIYINVCYIYQMQMVFSFHVAQCIGGFKSATKVCQ